MFSAVDGFRNTGSNIYVAIYDRGNATGSLDLYMKNDGNIYIAGSQPNVPIIYTDYTGYIKNQVELEGNANIIPIITRNIEVDNGGNIFVAGQAYGNGTNNDGFIMKLDSNFQPVWQTVFLTNSTINTDVFWSGAIDSTGNVYGAGTANLGAGSTPGVAVLGKYDTNGNLLFSKQYANTAQLIEIQTDGSDNFYTLGYRGTTPNTDGITYQKWDSNGNQIWGYEYTHANTDVVRDFASLVVDSGGNTILDIEVEDSSPPFTREVNLVKLYANGTQAWAKTPKRTGNTAQLVSAGPIATDGSNVYFVADLSTPDGGNLIIVKTDDTGNKVWERTLTTVGNVNYPSPASMVWANGYLGLSGTTGNSGAYANISVIRLPDDGGGIGTYGNYVYANTNEVTMSNGSITFSSLSDDSSNYTFDSYSSNFTSNTVSFTTNITYL